MPRMRRVVSSAPVGVVLSLAVAGTALGLSWSGRIPLTSSGNGFGDGIDQLDASSAVMSFVEWNGDGYNVGVRRSTTSGTSWDSPQILSTNGFDSDVAALSPYVDVVFEQNNRVRYVRSVNDGASYGPPMALSPKSRAFPINLSVARGPGGLVVVAWQNGNTNVVKVRVSTDNGVSFGSTTNFATNIQDEGTAVAAGNGVVYLAYKTEFDTLMVTRSTNGGVNWDPPVTATTSAYSVVDEFSLAAAGDHVYLAYSNINTAHPAWGTVRYRRSLDSGQTWSNERQLSPAAWKTEHPQIDLRNGVLRAVYGRRTSSGISIYFQKSNDGLNWGGAQLVDPNAHDPFVTYAGKVIVLFEVGTGNAYVRTGS
jgi:hypothetical protein